MPLFKTHKSNLQSRCNTRGYTLEEVMGCVVSQDGDEWIIDSDHPQYPHPKKNQQNTHSNIKTISEEITRRSADIGVGVGTELKKILAAFGIKSNNNCSCNEKAKLLNENGIEWAKQNVEEISSWLEEEAGKRKLPYFKYVGKKLIKLAIHRAEKLSNVSSSR